MYPNYYPFPQRQEVVRVNGRAGADMYQMAPSSSALLLDESAPIVWLKVTDGAGYATLTPYSIEPYQEKESVTLESIEKRLEKLEEKIDGKSDPVEAEHHGTAAAADAAAHISG